MHIVSIEEPARQQPALSEGDSTRFVASGCTARGALLVRDMFLSKTSGLNKAICLLRPGTAV